MTLLKQLIEKHNKIYIFVHQNPDGDAISSQNALESFVVERYPNKEVIKIVDDKPIIDKSSLGIVLDCSRASRVVHKGFLECKELLIIDHHEEPENLTANLILNVNAAATCELLAELLLEIDDKLSSTTAFWLYRGIISDSLNFTTNSTTANTLSIAAKLIKYKVDLNEVQRSLFLTSKAEFEFVNRIRDKAKYYDIGLIEVEITRAEVNAANVSMNFAKECVKEFNNIAGYQITVLFHEGEDGLFNASIRSKKIVVNKLATKYNGGGHKFASGCKKLSKQDKENLIRDLKGLISAEKQTSI